MGGGGWFRCDWAQFFPLLRPRGTLCFVGMCPPITADVFTMGFTMAKVAWCDVM